MLYKHIEKTCSASAGCGVEEKKMLKAVADVCIPPNPTDNCIKVNWVGYRQNCKCLWNGSF